MPIFQVDVANFTKMVENYEIRLRDPDFLQDFKHIVCQAKFDTTDALKEWIKENPIGFELFL